MRSRLESEFNTRVHVSFHEDEFWFEWTGHAPIDVQELYGILSEYDVQLSAFRLLGDFEYADGYVTLKGSAGPRLAYEETWPGDGKLDIEIIGYAGASPRVYKVRKYECPAPYDTE